MNRTEQDDRAIDALITRELLMRLSESEINAADVKVFMDDKTPLSKEDVEMLHGLDPFGRIGGRQAEASPHILQFPGLTVNLGEEPRLRAAARKQAEEITDPEALKALGEKRKEAIERARRRRSQSNKSQE